MIRIWRPDMDDVILINDQWYVLATTSRPDDHTRVLKHGETFALFDRYGDMQHIGIGDLGLYHTGTRFLSRFELTLNNRRPLLLNSTVKDDNSLMVVDLTTPDLFDGDRCILPKGTLHVFRSQLLWEGVLYQHIRMQNFSGHQTQFTMELNIDADYNDIFEVRGVRRKHTGKTLETIYGDSEVVMGYRGLDGVDRHTRMRFSILPDKCENKQIRFSFSLDPHQQHHFYIQTSCEVADSKPEQLDYFSAFQRTGEAIESIRHAAGEVFTSNEQYNDWLNRSAADLHMLITLTDHGAYPYAGVPWFSTPFGRDGIITALQYLWLYPEMAKGVLGYLSDTQARTHDAASDAEPGKILHEARHGEMADLGEIPFKQYYGSVDSTPLYIILAGEYYDRTGDRPFIESIWPNLEAALRWIDEYGDKDGDGYVEYARESENGLVQQGWKDSNDSVFHQNGILAEGPIAICEVQGYVYKAKLVFARLARLFGETERADQLEWQAQTLKRKFNEDFWCDELGTFALALDGEKRPCEVKASNAGHLLYAGIVNQEYARRTAETLLSATSFSKWGIRTLDESEVRYNPMSYHNGSVWPHDNAIIMMGLSRYGFQDKALQVMTGIFDAAISLELNRLPELFCGFERLPGQGPTLYPVACSPQAWASGAVFQMLQACLGLSFSASKPQIQFKFPQLPDYLQQLEITNLRFGDAIIDLSFHRHANDVGINILQKRGDIEIAIFK